MHLGVYSYFPLLKEFAPGGVQAFAQRLIPELAARNVQITFVGPAADDHAPLAGHDGVNVVSGLMTAKDVRPDPEAIADDLVRFREALEPADVILTFDRHLPLPCRQPVVLSLNNLTYGPEVASLFGAHWDCLVCPHRYLRAVADWYVSDDAWQGPSPPCRTVIPYGISCQSPADNVAVARLKDQLGIPDADRYLLFPHRPDPAKGFDVAVAAMAKLRRNGIDAVLLVPEVPTGDAWPHQRTYMKERREALGANADAVVFHRWILRSEMGAYFRMGDRTLCVGTLPETFGLTMVESVVAGTGVVATPAGALNDVLPPRHGVQFVDFYDADAIESALERDVDPAEIANGRTFITAEFAWERVADMWVKLLSELKKRRSAFVPRRHTAERPPWVRATPSGRIWDDYLARYVDM